MSDDEPRKLGAAARARAEGRSYNVELQRNAMAPLVHEDGSLRSKFPTPYLPVLGACSLCPARCCRLNVKVSLADAIRYCKVLSVPFDAGLTFVPSDHPTHAFELLRGPGFDPDPMIPWTGRAEIQLRRKEDGSCHALVKVGEYERCGVYGARPSICRIYPAMWSSDVAKGNPGMILCPVPYGVTPSEEAQLKQDIERSIEGWEEHDDIVLEWHETTKPEERTAAAFVEFAIPRAAKLAQISPEAILDKRTAEEKLISAMHGVRGR